MKFSSASDSYESKGKEAEVCVLIRQAESSIKALKHPTGGKR